jgi:hypothetical protein
MPGGGGWRLAFAMMILLVAALFFFEWLGSERPQKTVEIEIQPPATAADKENAND